MSILDSDYQKRLEELIEKEIKSLVSSKISHTDIATEVGKKIVEILEEKIKKAALPEGIISHTAINWNNLDPFSSFLKNVVYENFISTGIQDVADQIELTVADNLVVIENNLITKNAEIKEKLVANDLYANNIFITEKLILNENTNKQFVSLIKDTVKNDVALQTIDVVKNPILANGKEILNENTLGPSIINSNLRKLGRLQELNVGGIAQINDTLLVTNTGRIGINCSDPEGVVTIWDDDSELTIRKYKKKNMYIGTMRDTDLSIGTNNDAKLIIKRDGTIDVKQIEINGLLLTVSDSVPNRTGKPGEIVLMSNANEDEPWAYRCIGNDKWKAIK